MPTANVNILAVFVAALLTFVLGAFWYSPVLFARQWMQAQGYTPERLQEMKKKGLTRAYVASALCYLVMAYVVALFAAYTNSTTLAQGLWLGFLAWLGFAAPIGLSANLFSEKPIAAWVIDAGYQLAYLVIMGALLSVWR
jgi:Protein of unknown function (DUF1761)